MESLADILEQELEEAVEVKNKKSLRRYIIILTENLVRQDRNEREHADFREKFLAMETRMDERFSAVDKRFELIDKRFEQVDKRFEQIDRRFEAVDRKFNRITALLTAGFAFLAILITVFQFLG